MITLLRKQVKLFRACIFPKYQLSLSVYQEEAEKSGRNKKVVWFISLVYCFSIAGIGVGLIVLFFKELTIPTLVMSLLFIVYGYRLDGYLMIRERKSICRNDRRADHWAASD